MTSCFRKNCGLTRNGRNGTHTDNEKEEPGFNHLRIPKPMHRRNPIPTGPVKYHNIIELLQTGMSGLQKFSLSASVSTGSILTNNTPAQERPGRADCMGVPSGLNLSSADLDIVDQNRM